MAAKRQRRKLTPEFKAKIAIEALREREPIVELAKRYKVHPNQITAWKRQLLDQSAEGFRSGNDRRIEDQSELIEHLYQKIGQSQVELDWLKKNLVCSTAAKRAIIERDTELSVVRQCELIGLPHSSYYYQAVGESALNLELMRRIDEQYLRAPAYGVGMMLQHLRRLGYAINIKRVRRLYRLMGIEGLVPRPSLSKLRKGPDHTVYPYLLRGLVIDRPNQVWATDITYVPMPRGFLYLVAIIDWYTRFVLSWEISNSLENAFCREALQRALAQYGCPEIFNSDQGSQFTAHTFTRILLDHDIAISMDGRGRALDNVFIERLWRSYKYEYLYLFLPETGMELYRGTETSMLHFNTARPHSTFDGQSPADLYLIARQS